MRAFLLSMDAMVALTILLTLALFLTGLTFTYTSSELAYQRLYYSGNDLLNLMGNIRVADLQASPSIQYYMQEGILGQADLNKSLLDVIGALWSSQNTSAAANITQDVFGAVLNGTGTGFELVLGNTSIWSNNVTGPAFVARLTSIASGYGIGEPVSGFVASAHLVRMSKVTSGYVYFGGYVGDGNITVTAGLPED
ncbi:MAG: hypothetical protein ACE5FW_01040, partial [Candidatus Aenigmatarchaeota archaeon]